jgi:hypothetical protein
MAVDDAGDDIGEVGLRIDAAEFAGLDQRGDDRPVLGAAVGPGEERIFAIEGDGADRPFDDVGVDLDASVLEEAGEPLPSRERVADRFRELCLLADQAELLTQPRLERGDERPAPVATGGLAIVGGAAADLALDAVETGDALERLAGDGRRARRGEFIEAPANMRPAEGERDVSRITPSSIAGQRKRPSSKRLAKRQTPVPSQYTSLTRSARRARNT